MAVIEYNNFPFEAKFIDGAAHNEAFGRFFTAWSQVETAYCFVARQLTAMEPTIVSTLLDKARTTEVLEIITRLVGEMADQPRKQPLLGALASAKELSIKRNKLVHAGWGLFNSEIARFSHELTTEDFMEIANESQKGKSKRQNRVFTVQDIEQLTAKCIKTRDELTELAFSSPNKHFEQMSAIADLRRENLELRLMLHQGQFPQPQASQE